MTVYLSSSAYHTTSKDSTLLSPIQTQMNQAVRSPGKGSTERQPLLDDRDMNMTVEEDVKQPVEQPRKVMYYAAGSGIPEIKTILSGM